MPVRIRIQRWATFIRWMSAAWIVAVYVVPPVVQGVTDWDRFFDDAFLVGAVPGGLGLVLSYVLDRAGRKQDGSAPPVSP